LIFRVGKTRPGGNPVFLKVLKMKKVVFASAALIATGSAFASGPDFTTMTGGIDLTTVTAAILAVGVIAVNFTVVKGGAKAILGFITSAVK
jgi:hypothetical protein